MVIEWGGGDISCKKALLFTIFCRISCLAFFLFRNPHNLTTPSKNCSKRCFLGNGEPKFLTSHASDVIL